MSDLLSVGLTGLVWLGFGGVGRLPGRPGGLLGRVTFVGLPVWRAGLPGAGCARRRGNNLVKHRNTVNAEELARGSHLTT